LLVAMTFVIVAPIGALACTPPDDASGANAGGGGIANEVAGDLPVGDDAVVGRIVDGDTLRTEDDEAIRLLNIDTPEPREDECWADEATARLTELVPPGTEIRLVYDREREDRYGRTLAHIYRLDDGLWVNRQLAADGAAYPYVLRPNDREYDVIDDAAQDARRAGLGLWSACNR
jgi:micrococcal nuclease